MILTFLLKSKDIYYWKLTTFVSINHKSRLKRWAQSAKKGLLSVARSAGGIVKDMAKLGFNVAKDVATPIAGAVLTAYLTKKATEKGLPGFEKKQEGGRVQQFTGLLAPGPPVMESVGSGCQCGGRVALPQAVGRAGNPIAMRQRQPQRMDGGMMNRIMHARKSNGRRKIMGHN